MNCFWPQAVLYEMNVRQLTPEGTLRAATSKLPFLKDLGVDAVWLMPVYPIGEAGRKGSLGSYYSIRDYCAVNPELGTMADFDAFVAEAHRLGMRVLLDWVANHTARDARWIAEKPASWYERDAAGRPAVPWDWSDTAKLNYADRDVWRAQADAMEFWLTQHDVDGFRCDMAMLVPIEFWNETSLRLRRVKPDLFMLAEAEERNLFEEGAFDACYAWRMHHLMNDVARQRTRVTALRDYIYADRDDYPDSAMRLAFTSNHDENSWNGSEFSRLGDAREIMAVFTFVVPRGLPLIYTGQEIGYDHSFAFFDRDPIPRYEGFTGEKYGGVTYWDTEAYCLPFYLATAGRAVARELLVYRYNQLDKAIENAAKLGFRDGAALYPMVTVNGEECHNEWEITFEEIHRNGAVAYAIFNYIRYTGDTAYLADCGLEVLLSVARFWAQRITWSGARRKYVMLGVTGPNEYENNVDNNWYTSYIACWSMRYAAESAAWVRENRPADYARICAKRRFDETAETKRWLEIADGMYFGEDRELGIFLQQDGYLDKEQTLAKDLDPADRPINQRWSWDRILRSCLIKQADVLQGLYFFGDDFDLDTVRRNFRFYEARTVHESSLSPCVHAILAARIGDLDKAYELYLRTARLDLDDYNREVREGCHVTSMAGSWLSVVEGFGGMRVRDGVLSFDPQLPAAWESLSFKVNFQDRVLTVRITRNAVEVANEGAPVELEIRGVRRLIADKVIMNCEL